jgi:hypothetical protein
MELAVIVVLAILAFGVITIPIMRGGGAATDGMSGASVEEEIASGGRDRAVSCGGARRHGLSPLRSGEPSRLALLQ